VPRALRFTERRFTDDLPAVKISRLRAFDIITAETTEFVVRLGDVEQTVAVKLRKFPNGGSWSLFVCPTCGRRAQVLRLLNGAVLCRVCCIRRGVRWRAEPMGLPKRAAYRAPKLLARLNSTESLRLKPHLWGTMERRTAHEAALQRCMLIVKRHELAALAKAIDKTKPRG
jgi:hypothetical protein